MPGGSEQRRGGRFVSLTRPGAVAAFLFVGLALVYLGTLTSAWVHDGLAYSGYVIVALLGRHDLLFQTNHLLYGPIA